MTTEDEKEKGGLSLFAKHAVQYYVVGLSGVGVNLGLLYVLTEFVGIWYLGSQIIAILVSITSNFFFDRFWTFKNSIKDQRNSVMYIKFLIISFIGMGIQLVVTFVLVENFVIYYMYSAGIAILCAGSIGYIANRRWTFGIKFKN